MQPKAGQPSPLPPLHHEVVVARFNENLDWALPLAHKTIVYNKGEEDDPFLRLKPLLRGCISLPNVGREAHTILTHIINNYDRLPDLTTFMQGRFNDAPLLDFADVKKMLAGVPGSTPVYAAAWAPRFHITHWAGSDLHDAGMDFGTYWSTYLPDVPMPSLPSPGSDEPYPMYFPQYGSYMIVEREAIRNRSVGFYQRLRDTVAMANAPEAAHFLERMWHYIFWPQAAGE